MTLTWIDESCLHWIHNCLHHVRWFRRYLMLFVLFRCQNCCHFFFICLRICQINSLVLQMMRSISPVKFFMLFCSLSFSVLILRLIPCHISYIWTESNPAINIYCSRCCWRLFMESIVIDVFKVVLVNVFQGPWSSWFPNTTLFLTACRCSCRRAAIVTVVLLILQTTSRQWFPGRRWLMTCQMLCFLITFWRRLLLLLLLVWFPDYDWITGRRIFWLKRIQGFLLMLLLVKWIRSWCRMRMKCLLIVSCLLFFGSRGWRLFSLLQ